MMDGRIDKLGTVDLGLHLLEALALPWPPPAWTTSGWDNIPVAWITEEPRGVSGQMLLAQIRSVLAQSNEIEPEGLDAVCDKVQAAVGSLQIAGLVRGTHRGLTYGKDHWFRDNTWGLTAAGWQVLAQHQLMARHLSERNSK